jgi:hypothetical protein
MGIPTKMTPGAHRPERPSPALVFDTLMVHQRTAALRAAIELDVFRAVGEGPGDVASLARQCSASERGIRILCDYLTIIGLLSKEEGRYCEAGFERISGHPLPTGPHTVVVGHAVQ